MFIDKWLNATGNVNLVAEAIHICCPQFMVQQDNVPIQALRAIQ